MFQAPIADDRRNLGKAAVRDREARVVTKTRLCDAHRLGILVERQQATPFAEGLEDAGTVAAAAEGTIYIGAVRTDAQRFDRLVEQDRDMGGNRLCHSVSPPSCSDRPPASDATSASQRSRLPFQDSSSQISSLLTCPTSDTRFSRPA